jgi:hypothetical protein
MIATKMQHNTTRIAVVAITVTFRNKYMQAENADAIPQDELGSVHHHGFLSTCDSHCGEPKRLPSQTKILDGRTNVSECVSRGSTFQGCEYSIWATTQTAQDGRISAKHFQIYPSQTKILEGLTKGEIKIFDIHLKGVSTRFGLQTIEKYIENLDFIFCQSFQNLRLGSIKFQNARATTL